MEILFVHPNFPGQFRRFAAALSREPGIRVHGLGDEAWMKNTSPVPDIPVIAYSSPLEPAADSVHPYVRSFEAAVRRGQQAVQTLLAHKRQGLEPDIVFVHPGWGDGFYLKSIFPGAKIVGLFEYYYRTRGADVGFDPEFPMNFDDVFRVHTLNATQLLALESCDTGYCPTAWQKNCFPAHVQDRLRVIHDGIDTKRVHPDTAASLRLTNGSEFHAGQEILTFSSRNLEPYRGYHVFMRALPRILSQRPNCQVLIIGGDRVSYGKPLPPGQTYRQRYFDEVSDKLDHSRVHFTGALPYDDFLRALQVSRVHVYLSYPFILSWSMLEAMASGCLVIGSATPAVQEVIHDGKNGLLVPFKDPIALAARTIEALDNPNAFTPLRHAAREHIVTCYDFANVCYPAFKHLISDLNI
ncbi:MAG: glycosyltransferase [Clostridia bacterium]|nr:glycosyltransferase [Clostridia bacterium]